jgi:hypothetical protein
MLVVFKMLHEFRETLIFTKTIYQCVTPIQVFSSLLKHALNEVVFVKKGVEKIKTFNIKA